MKITRVQVRKFDNDNSNVKGVAEVTLNKCFVIKDIRIVQKPEKIVVAMPSKAVVSKEFMENGEVKRKHKDLAHPLNQETRKIFNDTILGVYERANTNSDTDYTEDLNVLVCNDED